MTTEMKLSNAYKIFLLKHPTYIGKPSLKELKKDGLLDNVDFDEEDDISELYSSEEIVQTI